MYEVEPNNSIIIKDILNDQIVTFIKRLREEIEAIKGDETELEVLKQKICALKSK